MQAVDLVLGICFMVRRTVIAFCTSQKHVPVSVYFSTIPDDVNVYRQKQMT